MQIMLNSCDPKEIEEALSWGIVGGITMNPSMMGKSGRDFLELFRQIRAMTDVTVFAQVVTEDPADILRQGKLLSGLGENIVVKVHTGIGGLKGMRLLKQEGVRVCATAVHSVIESVMVGAADADYVALFTGLLAEVDESDANRLPREVRQAYSASGVRTKIMVAARTVNQVVNAVSVGVDAVTLPFSLWQHFLNNSYTRNRWAAFSADWRRAFGDRDWGTELGGGSQ